MKKKGSKPRSARPRRASKNRNFFNFLAKKIKILAFAFIFVLATGLVFLSVYFYQFLHFNLARAGNGLATEIKNLETGHDFNLVFFKIKDFKDPTSLMEEVYLANFQVKAGRLNLLGLSPEETVTNLQGTGKVKVAALYGLAHLADATRFDAFGKTLSLNFGLPIDGVFYVDELGFQKVKANLDFLKNPSGRGWDFRSRLATLKSLFLLGSAYQTSLNLQSFLAFSQYLALDAPGSFRIFKVTDFMGQTEKADLLLRENFLDQEVANERLKIIILNGTGRAGLAGSAARMASNLGLTVLTTGNPEQGETFQDSVLFTKTKSYYTVSRLAQIFSLKNLRLTEEVATDPRFNRLLRADLILILGRDQIGSKSAD